MTTTTIFVPEIHCEHCKQSIEGALTAVPGVRAAQVDVDARNVTVEFDEASVDQASIVTAVEEQGYEVPA